MGDYLEIWVGRGEVQPQLSGSILGLEFLRRRQDFVHDFVNFVTSTGPFPAEGCVISKEESNSDPLSVPCGRYNDDNLKIQYTSRDHNNETDYITTATDDSLETHIESNKQTNNVGDVTIAKHNLHNVSKYKCEKCGEDFLFETRLEAHRNRSVACVSKDMLRWGEPEAASETILYTDIVTGVDMQITPLQALEKSAAIKHDNGYRCIICGMLLKSKLTLRKHIFCRHSKNKPFKCEYCTKSFKLEERLKDHKICVHAGKAFDCVACKLCKKKFESKMLLKRHLTSRCSETTKVTPECTICGYTASCNARLQEHYNTHFSENMHECEICGKRLAWAYSLNLHRLHKHSVDAASFHCPVCKLEFSTKQKFRHHLQTHKEAGFRCDICRKSFHHAAALRQHEQVHTTGNTFVCEQCGKCFRIKASLKTHMLVHSDDRPHSCKECSATFRTRQTLKQHEQTHAGSQHMCDVCGRQFSQIGSLHSHLRSHVQSETVGDTQAPAANVPETETSDSQDPGEFYTAKKYIL